MAAPRFINELTAAGSLSAGAALVVFQDGDTFRTTPQALITEAPSFTQSGSGAVSRPVSGKLQETVSVLDFIPVASHAGIAAGSVTSDLTAYFVLALATGKRVFVPAGTYYVNVTQFASNAYLFGEGEATVIRAFTTTASTLKCLSADASTFITGVTIRDLKLFGTVVAESFNANPALIDFTGVKRCRIENVYFEGFRLDGIYLGGNVGASEYHNLEVIIKNCVFDGVNNGGRNGISVIDCDGIEIEGNVFRNCAKSDQPGSIDFEPNQSFSVIKNVRVMNNRFYNTDGNRGHVTFSVHNIDSANFANVTVSGNHFEDGDAVVVYTDDTTPSVFPSATQNIIIADNIAINVTNFLEKQTGPIYGLIIADNIICGTSAGQGRIVIGDGSTDWTVKDITITGNQITSNIAIPVAISDNSENVIFSKNIMRGATQAHTRFGITGTATTNYIVKDNVFLGSPSNGMCQHDASTHNISTNFWKDNFAPVGVGHTFRALRTDFTGTSNPVGFQISALPSEWPYGVSLTRVSGDTVDAASQTGILYTHKESAAANTLIYQWFVPDYSATYKDDLYFRKAVDASNWDGWYQLTGT